MADNIKQSIQFDASSANAELKKLSDNVAKYNEVIKAQTTATRAQNRIQKAAVGRMETFNERLSQASKLLNPINTRLETQNAALKDVNRRLLTSNDRFTKLNTQMKEHSRDLARASAQAANFATGLKQVNDSLQKDASAVIQGVALLRRFNKEMKGVISTMKVKNANLRNQAAAATADSAATNVLSTSLARLQEHIRSVIRIAQGFLLHRAIAEAVAAMREAVVEAKDLSIRIAEIQTISQDAAKSVADWQHQLVGLSSAFGLSTIENAEGAYQALSNQVVKAGNAAAFLREENKLALIGVSTLKDATSVTTSVLNAYGESAIRARERNAQLFRTVELGRLRLEELGDTLGRVNILSNQLGITFEEQQAAIATLTRQGVRAQEAITLLRNIQLKLVKPTERMQELFEQWGVQSGQAAIATFGFTGTIRKMIAEIEAGGNASAEIGKIFGRLRSIVGFTGLAGSFDQFNDNLEQIRDSGPAAAKALEISLNSFGKRAEIQIQKIKNLFLVEFGASIVRTFVQVSESFGGADKILRRLYDVLKTGVTIWASYKVAVIAVAGIQVLMNQQWLLSTLRAGQFGTALSGLTAAVGGFRFAVAGTTLGLSLLLPMLFEAAFGVDNLKNTVVAAGHEIDAALANRLDAAFARFDERVTKAMNSIQDSTTQGLRAFHLFVAGVNKEITTLDRDIEQRFKLIGSSIKTNIRDALNNASKELTSFRREIRRLEGAQIRRGNRAAGLEFDLQEDQTRFNSREGTEVQQIAALNRLKNTIRAQALEELKKGEDEVAATLFSRVQKLHGEVVRRLEQLKRDASSVVSTTRRVREIDPLTGRPRITTKRTERTKDPRTAKEAGETLNQLEKERLDIVRLRIQLEQKNFKTQEALLRKQKQQEQQRSAAIQGLQDTLASLDSVKAGDGTSIQQFDALFLKARKQAEQAGIGGADSLRLFRSLLAKRIELARATALKIAKEERDIAVKALKEVEERVKNTQKIVKEKAAIPRQAVQPATEALQKQAKELRAFFIGIGANRNLTPGPRGQVRRHPLADSLRSVETVLKNISNIDKEKNPVAVITKQLVILTDVLAKLDKQSEKGLLKKAPGFFFPGQENVEREGGFPRIGDSTTAERRRQLVQLQTEFNKAQAEGEVAVKAFNLALKQQALIQERLKKLPKEIREEAAAQVNERINQQQALHKMMDGTIERLEKIRKLNAAIGAAARPEPSGAPAPPRAFANGGFAGRDRMPALLTRGESVLNPVATRAFAPMISALNSSRPGFGNQNTSSYNFGDINITTQGGTSEEIGPKVLAHLQRAIRRGQLQV